MRSCALPLKLLLGCALAVASCSTERQPLAQGSLAPELATELPSECSAHESFRHGFPFAIALRLGDGPEVLFLLDTGCSKTTLDTSFEPSLGPSLRRELVANLETGDKRQKVFAAPKLYLGNTRLISGDTVLTAKVRTPDDCPYKGILGMDCLSHYCIQIDFAVGKLRFLDPAHLQREDLGTAFPVVADFLRSPIIEMNLSGLGNLRFLVDSGFWNVVDATLRPAQMRTASENKMVTPTSLFVGFKVFSCETMAFGRESYRDLLLGEVPVEGKDFDGAIGFRFLARHVVTFDFPNRVLYFKRNTSG